MNRRCEIKSRRNEKHENKPKHEIIKAESNRFEDEMKMCRRKSKLNKETGLILKNSSEFLFKLCRSSMKFKISLCRSCRYTRICTKMCRYTRIEMQIHEDCNAADTRGFADTRGLVHIFVQIHEDWSKISQKIFPIFGKFFKGFQFKTLIKWFILLIILGTISFQLIYLGFMWFIILLVLFVFVWIFVSLIDAYDWMKKCYVSVLISVVKLL